MSKISAIGHVENGVLKIQHRRIFDAALKNLSDGNVAIEVKRIYRNRSNKQNSFYHGIILPMVTMKLIEMGNEITAEDTHVYLKEKFNSQPLINKETAEIIGTYPGSTSRMETVEMNGYWDAIMKWSSEVLELYIPEPDKDWKDKI